MAHTPRAPTAAPDAKPTVAPVAGGKIPPSVRNRYLALFVDEAAKFAGSREEANHIV